MYSIPSIMIKVEVDLLDCYFLSLAVLILEFVSCTASVPVFECNRVECSSRMVLTSPRRVRTSLINVPSCSTSLGNFSESNSSTLFSSAGKRSPSLVVHSSFIRLCREVVALSNSFRTVYP